MKECWDKQLDDLNGLIMMVQGDLTKAVRTKIMCMITMDAHSRDIIEQLYKAGVSRVDEF
jgi:dynein heavy chain